MKHKSNVTYIEAKNWASSFLKQHQREEDIAYHYLMGLLDWTLTDWVRQQRQRMPNSQQECYIQGIHHIVEDHVPYQYLLGEAWFYHYKFKVTRDTLIPRSDTEKLVEAILDKWKQKVIKQQATILDIGTGSGAIAITLAKENPNFQITATDISSKALDVAKENNERLNANVTFKLGDLFAPVSTQKFDVIVSNPPYIGREEWPLMGEDVLLYEPHLALFADDKGYAFYHRLFQEVDHHLNKKGILLVECGYQQAKTLKKELIQYFPTANITIIQDYAGIERIVCMEK